MRRADLVAAIVLALCSAGIMWKSAELPIGWIPREGPGGGAFPFWLGAGMLGCCVWIIVRWMRRTSPVSCSTEPYMDKQALRVFLTHAGALTVAIGLIEVIGVYGMVPVLLVFYMRFVGRHRWRLVVAYAVLTPVVTFLLFEIVLRITLPKGYTEPLFYPLFNIFFH